MTVSAIQESSDENILARGAADVNSKYSYGSERSKTTDRRHFGKQYYTHRTVTPVGETFVLAKEDAAQELSRGVTVSGSLADTTSAASKASITGDKTVVNPETSERNVKHSLPETANAEPTTAEAFTNGSQSLGGNTSHCHSRKR